MPHKSGDLFSRNTQMHIRFKLNSSKRVLLPQPPFPRQPRQFTSPNSASSLQELLQRISLSLSGISSEPNEPPPGSAPVMSCNRSASDMTVHPVSSTTCFTGELQQLLLRQPMMPGNTSPVDCCSSSALSPMLPSLL